MDDEYTEEDRDGVLVKKIEKTGDPLGEMMSWNPRRVGKQKPVSEREVKEV